MHIKFLEFDIPAVTVQADSLNSENVRSANVADRWLCGSVDNTLDPNFGKVSASIFTKLRPGAKLYKVGRSGFTLTKATLNLTLDYYVYGDTLNSESSFTLHEITEPGFSNENAYFTTSNLAYDPTPISTGVYQFKIDSIKKYITVNSDKVSTNDVHDTLTFELPIDAGLAKVLFDTLKGKGVYVKKKKKDGVTDSLAYSTFKTDSIFGKVFNGIVIRPKDGNRVLGFTSRVNSATTSSRLSLYFSYYDSTDNIIKNSQYNYYFQDANYYQDIPNFTKIEYDRASTSLSGLSQANKYINYNSPDGYAYVQAATGLYTKLDLTAIMDTVKSYEKITINSAEIIVPVETNVARPHVRIPSGFYLRVIGESNRFFVPPLIPAISNGQAVLTPDPLYGGNYYCGSNETYLDAIGDDGNLLDLQYQVDDNGQYYRSYLTQFFEYHARLPSYVPKVNHMALVPATAWGKSLSGVSFKNDKIKIRLFYSVPN